MHRNSFGDFLDIFRNVIFYLIFAAATLGLAYYTHVRIKTLPQPETFIELVKFYFKAPVGYLKIILLCLATFVVSGVLGVATVKNAIQAFEEFTLWLCIPFAILGLGFIGLSFYFLAYFGWLLFVILIIGVLAIFFFGNNRR